MRKNQMRMVTMREFRNNFANLGEPVRVLRSRGNIEIIGTWTPEKERAGREPEREPIP